MVYNVSCKFVLCHELFTLLSPWNIHNYLFIDCFSGGIPDVQLEKNIEEWILEKTNSSVDFDSSEAVKLLKNLGILSVVNDKLHVLNLQAAIRNLPQQPQSLIARAEESDIYEGYDRDEFLETEEEYRDEEKKSKRYGWFWCPCHSKS